MCEMIRNTDLRWSKKEGSPLRTVHIKKTLVHAKLPSTRPARHIPGMSMCTKCKICPFVDPSKTFKSTHTNTKYNMTGSFSCNTIGVIYLLTCTHCSKQYVGETGRKLKERIKEHITDRDNNEKTVGSHYNLPGHQKAYFKVQVIERVMPNDKFYRLEREDFWMKKLNTMNPIGLNVMG